MLVYSGKTKDLMQDEVGQYYFKFKDDVTGKDGVFDPGENQVGATIEGSGHSNVIVSTRFFKLLEEQGVPTHFVSSDVDNLTMHVKKASVFGQGLEVICRFKAVGSFIRRYGAYIESGTDLDSYVEFTLKDDERQDPLITQDALEQLGILKDGEYEELKRLTQSISQAIKDDLAKKDLELYDIKLEFGRIDGTDEIVLIDEVSGGNMRVFADGESVHPLDLVNYYK